MSGLNDDLDEELKLAAEVQIDPKTLLDPKHKPMQQMPVNFVIDTTKGKDTDNDFTAKDFFGPDIEPGVLPNSEVTVYMINQIDSKLSNTEEIMSNVSNNNSISQEDIKTLIEVQPEYLTPSDNINYYTKSPSKTKFTQAVVRVNSLLAAQQANRVELVEQLKVEAAASLDALTKSVNEFYTVGKVDRDFSLKKYSKLGSDRAYNKQLLASSFDKYCDDNLAFVIFINTLEAGGSVDYQKLVCLSQPAYVAANLQERDFSIYSLTKFVGSDYEKKFFEVDLVATINKIRDCLNSKQECDVNQTQEMCKVITTTNRILKTYSLVCGVVVQIAQSYYTE